MTSVVLLFLRRDDDNYYISWISWINVPFAISELVIANAIYQLYVKVCYVYFSLFLSSLLLFLAVHLASSSSSFGFFIIIFLILFSSSRCSFPFLLFLHMLCVPSSPLSSPRWLSSLLSTPFSRFSLSLFVSRSRSPHPHHSSYLFSVFLLLLSLLLQTGGILSKIIQTLETRGPPRRGRRMEGYGGRYRNKTAVKLRLLQLVCSLRDHEVMNNLWVPPVRTKFIKLKELKL